MNLKPALISLGLALSGAAQATDTNMGDVTGIVTSPSIIQVAAGSFLDRYFFQVTANSMGTGTIADIEIGLPGGGFLWNINNLTATLYLDTGSIGSYDAGIDDVTFVVLGTGDFLQDTGPMPIGNYYFSISGDADGSAGGTYMWHAAAQPVPEAETWAMMAAGLGLVGMQLRRRTRGGRLTS